MDALLFNVTTAGLMVLMFKAGTTLNGPDPLRTHRVPLVAAGLTAIALLAVLTQLCWPGAMDTFDSDPSKSGWWRVVTSVFMQNGGFLGAAWNIATLAVIAALAEWFWGSYLTAAFFAAGILLPQHIDALFGLSDRSTVDPRNFAGSSGATYFLGATLAAGLLLWRTPGLATEPKARMLALAVPALGLTMWLTQSNGHGLVAVYGFTLACAVALWRRTRPPSTRREASAGGQRPLEERQ
ncbi:hypothetical protein AB0N05_13375 [Nocardia sp. NPDC051030]|uniref:hypothetical protein n=1 Tax=Nocardia sp. NPDC051030 TaxID=3155162 RepID=UPI0034158446